MILRHYDRKLKSSSLSEVDAMAINALSNAKRSLQELVQKADPAAKEQLTAIANALEDVEERLKALEAVVEALAVRATKPTGNDIPTFVVDWSYVKKLLGGDRM